MGEKSSKHKESLRRGEGTEGHFATVRTSRVCQEMHEVQQQFLFTQRHEHKHKTRLWGQ